MLRKILAVDDSALIHQMYKLFLSRYKNCKLVSAMNGLDALDKLAQEEGIDLILLDINMPVMNGLEFLQRIQKEPAYQPIPVIIISTEGKEEDTIRGLKMGAKGYVKKPFQASELHGLIEKIDLIVLNLLNDDNPDAGASFQIGDRQVNRTEYLRWLLQARSDYVRELMRTPVWETTVLQTPA